MIVKKNKVFFGAFCVSVAVAATAVAQNDLDNLLNDFYFGLVKTLTHLLYKPNVAEKGGT